MELAIVISNCICSSRTTEMVRIRYIQIMLNNIQKETTLIYIMRMKKE